MNAAQKHVAVLMGGWSAEREVSLRSGRACADAAERVGYRVTRVDVGRDIATVLTTLKHFRHEYEAHIREGRCTLPADWRARRPAGVHA